MNLTGNLGWTSRRVGGILALCWKYWQLWMMRRGILAEMLSGASRFLMLETPLRIFFFFFRQPPLLSSQLECVVLGRILCESFSPQVHDAAEDWVRHVFDGTAIKVFRRRIFFVCVAHHSVSRPFLADLTLVNCSLDGIIHHQAINITRLRLPISERR